MNNWEKCKKRFPQRTQITNPEKEHLPITLDDFFAATEQGQRFLFGHISDTILWTAGPSHPWRELDDNEEVLNELLTAKFLICVLHVT